MKDTEAKAGELHENMTVIDGLNASVMNEEYLQKIQEGGVTAVNHTVGMQHNITETVNTIANLLELIRKSDSATRITTVRDIEKAAEDKKAGIIFGFQNVAPLEMGGKQDVDPDIKILNVYKKLGVRIIQLTYHYRNICGDGSKEESDCGLSAFGNRLVSKLNEHGIVVDLAHVGDNTSRDAIKASEDPVVMSHSNSYYLSPVYQNKEDETIELLAENDGVIGISAFPRMLDKESPSLEDMLDHIDYIVDLVGVDYVGIGTDFSEGWAENPFMRKKLLKIDGKIYDYPKGLSTVTEMPNLTESLISRGYSEKEVRKIMGGNFLRVFSEVWD